MSEDMHSRHDLDLIAAYAEERLEDPAPAEELVASCPECADLYRSHVIVRRAIAEAPPVAMTEFERRRLRDRIWDTAELAPAKPAPASTPWWYRLAPVAAVLAVVVGAGGVFLSGGLGTGDSAETDAPTAAVAPEAAADETVGVSDGETDAGLMAAPDTTEAMSEDPAPAGGIEESAAADQAEFRLDLSMTELEEVISEFLERVDSGETEVDEEFDCLSEAPLDESPMAAESIRLADTTLWLVALGENGEVGRVEVYRQADCALVHLEG